MCFNPRTRTGCDPILVYGDSLITGFNPRTRTGCDRSRRIVLSFLRRFQPTHPHGVRRLLFSGPTGCWSFNPRTRTGCDDYIGGKYGAIFEVSTHAPARGAT